MLNRWYLFNNIQEESSQRLLVKAMLLLDHEILVIANGNADYGLQDRFHEDEHHAPNYFLFGVKPHLVQ